MAHQGIGLTALDDIRISRKGRDIEVALHLQPREQSVQEAS